MFGVAATLFACALVVVARVLHIVRREHQRLVLAVHYSPKRTSEPCTLRHSPAATMQNDVCCAKSTAGMVVAAELDPPPTKFDPDLEQLRAIWLDDIRPRFSPAIEEDPFLSPPNVDDMLRRFLDAERGSDEAPPAPPSSEGESNGTASRTARRRAKVSDVVLRTATRLEQTAEFRRDYDCCAFHQRGMARRLFMHGSNAGASVYFGDCGLCTGDNRPVLLGRVSLMTDAKAPRRKPADTMLPAQHLRAAMFVVERAAVELIHRGEGAKGAYILDVGSYPRAEMAGFAERYWDADGLPAAGATLPCVGPSLPGHHALHGLSVLKEALRMMERFYPETMHRVFFYRPGAAFRLIFAIFSLWVPRSTRARFALVREGEEHRFFEPAPAGCGLVPDQTPRELGGSGPSLDGDRFLMRACERYDARALFPAAAST